MVILTENIPNQGSRLYTAYNLFTTEQITLEIGQKIPPSFVIALPWLVGGDIKKAFAEWLHGERIRPDEVNKKQGTMEGTLMAQKYHLEDLRQLLKLNTEKDRIPK